MKKATATQDDIKRLFRYDENTGVLTRRVKKHTANPGDVAGNLTSKGYWQSDRGQIITE
jgi:hypothetical protein